MSPIEVFLCGLIALLGLVFVLIGLRQRQRALASARWPGVPGRALSAEVKKQVYTTGKGNSRRSDAWYSPNVKYEYVVDGVRYESDRVAFGGLQKHSEEEVRQVIEKAMPAGSLRVFYNPRRPQDAVLLNTEQSGVGGALVAGVVIIIAAAVTALYFLIK